MTDPITGGVILALIGMLSFMVLFMYNPGTAVSALLLTVLWAAFATQSGPELATVKIVTIVTGGITGLANLYVLSELQEFTNQYITGRRHARHGNGGRSMSVLLAIVVLTVIAAIGAYVGAFLLGVASTSLLHFGLYTLAIVGSANLLATYAGMRTNEDNDIVPAFVVSIFVGAIFARMAYLVTLGSL